MSRLKLFIPGLDRIIQEVDVNPVAVIIRGDDHEFRQRIACLQCGATRIRSQFGQQRGGSVLTMFHKRLLLDPILPESSTSTTVS